MKIYKLTDDYENYYTFTIKGVELYSKMPSYSPRFDATARLSEWVTPDGSFYASANYTNNKVAIPDITTWVTGNLILNSAAYKILADKLNRSGEFLPVTIEGIDYYIFNTLKVIADKNTSKDQPNKGLESVSFPANELEGIYVFKVTSDNVLHTYCTESFKQLVFDNNLNGLLFNEINLT
jgi:hypothetical protein